MSQAAEGSNADAHEVLVEEFGMHVGRAMGWPPMAGRAAGLLMLSEKPMTLAELQEALDASKGSVSEMTRLLVTNGTVERYKEAGQRHFVFRWREDAWAGCLQHIVSSTAQLRELAEQAQLRGARMTAVQQHRLGEMQEYYRFMVSRLESMLSEYTAARESRRTQP
ncbi:hypothetical protein OG379_05300 [Streptomyces sp. NBC_01166]|uniref:GbsR/MarR family transcriptional regulator n=1 Tax=Streptomyces sp. NBC_01166 TaxID=2903755 RepID=UPI0038701760|nr:hypothetical protein OG379_05300 [Streptomyces sp. NBC_01166]